MSFCVDNIGCEKCNVAPRANEVEDNLPFTRVLLIMDAWFKTEAIVQCSHCQALYFEEYNNGYSEYSEAGYRECREIRISWTPIKMDEIYDIKRYGYMLDYLEKKIVMRPSLVLDGKQNLAWVFSSNCTTKNDVDHPIEKKKGILALYNYLKLKMTEFRVVIHGCL